MSEQTCPNCGNKVAELLRLDGDMKARMSSELGRTGLAESVCPNCYNSFGSELAQDAQKKSKRAAKEQHRLNLWRSRVHLIREARERFAIKDFPGAVVAYEKYFRVLEIIYEVKPNEILPSHFNNSARSKELVVIASAFWDLVRIYDQSKKFSKRFEQCSSKLAEFLPYTPIYSEIMRKVEDYKKVAKNREVFDQLTKDLSKGKKRCFIATAAFESPDAPTVLELCRFRDLVLVRSLTGRAFIKFYYTFSPAIAQILDRNRPLRAITRKGLSLLAPFLSRST